MNQITLLHRRLRRAVLGRRRLLAAVLAAVSVAAGLRALAAPPPATSTVLTAAHDLASGTVLTRDDLVGEQFAPGSVPSGALRASEAVGRTTAAPLRAGEAVTDVRLVGNSLLDGYAGLVAAPVRIGDAGVVDLLRVGDRIDLLAADPQAPTSGEATVVASHAPVVALPHGDADARFPATADNGGALVVVAVSPVTAQRLALAGVSSFISVVLNR